MILNKKHGYFNPMADWCRRFDRIESLVYGRFSSAWPEIHGSDIYNLREVILLLNFCYFFSLYFIPIQLHQAVVFIDKIVQRAFGLVTVLIFFIRYMLDLLECRGYSGYLPLGLLRGFYHLVFALAGFCALILKVL